MPTVETPAVSRAGIATSSTGERHIPSSVRPDGSVRKEIRVRPGYRPPEDVEVYKNRTAEGFRNRVKGAVLGAVPGAESLRPNQDTLKSSPAANKNAKRREARKKAAAAASDEKEGEKPNEDTPKPANLTGTAPSAAAEPEKPTGPEVEKDKEAKKLLKKLRQAKDLMDKKENGDKLLPEQFEKVIKINELIRQLQTLGIDAQGDKKPET